MGTGTHINDSSVGVIMLKLPIGDSDLCEDFKDEEIESLVAVPVGNHKMVSDKRPETNSLGYKEDSEPSIKRVSYADTVMRNSKSEEMKE